MTALEVREVTVQFGGPPRARRRLAPGRGRHHHRAHRPERRRQDHAVQRDLRSPAPRARPRPARRHGRHAPGALQAGTPGLARTFQRLEPFGLLTVRENVRLAADIARRPDPDDVADQLLDRLGVTDLADVRADRLPTGQARRVELARALATDPAVLLLDEPASGQDEGETAAFAEVLREVASTGVAVVLVEHDVPLVMAVCAQIHVLDLGRVLAIRHARARCSGTTPCSPPTWGRCRDTAPLAPRRPRRLRPDRGAARDRPRRPRGQRGRHPRAERRRQDDPAEHHRRAARDRRPARSRSPVVG